MPGTKKRSKAGTKHACEPGEEKRAATSVPSSRGDPETKRCGLCGKTRRLARTDCYGRWICDDEHKYVLFSYARNSCHRNHRRYTLCGRHHAEGHEGDWKVCGKCRRDFETEIYVYFGTNQYNFEKLESPPAYEPTRCTKCGTVLNLGEGGYSVKGEAYFCLPCGGHRL
jgi:hypothetical protein